MEIQKIQDPFKIILIGDTGVGKTNLVTRYTKNSFNETTKPTIGVEFYTKKISITDSNSKIENTLQIWDTAGQERFRGMAGSYYRRALGVILVYDITSRKSFENLDKWLDEVKAYGGVNMEIALVGNKNDLVEQREVKIEEGIIFSKKNNLFFYETSALKNEDLKVEEMFNEMAVRINKNKKNNSFEEELGNKGFNIKERNSEEVQPALKKKKNRCC